LRSRPSTEQGDEKRFPYSTMQESQMISSTKRGACGALLAIALAATHANAADGGRYAATPGTTSGPYVPAWVARECHPATGAQMLAWMAGPGQWFYRGSDNFCWLDTRPGVG
jgi:hypothetical protein